MAGYIDALRFTLAEMLGENDRVVVLNAPAAAPPSVARALEDAAERLVIYQGRRYARLYLDRLLRFVGRRDVDDAMLLRIAELLAIRMAYEDPIRIAQLTLQEAASVPAGRGKPRIDHRCRFRIDEVVAALPVVVAAPTLRVLDYLGWQHMPVKMRFNAGGWLGTRKLRIISWLRRWRLLSIRYAHERKWVERWLHMIDRSLAVRPDAAVAVIESATMVHGYGDAYRYGMANWTLIVDELVKPAVNGRLPLPDLAQAIAEARAAATPERKQTSLKRAIEAIKARCGDVPIQAAAS
ncbi:hypothetical protein DNX69_03105 [Rhodopseudomonas palustris]|uniref:DUF6537 domain-containing protein n=1 Tax=Rhodopseudomonas palustris TaxID=1076 RepID=A0A323UQG5_RHOPL|nr:DUF6537 domain-containing protein [Rhodopseudomonas palustris]PZA13376.1 hypothetical protein DNX69_03105 [Rhodopseudomonas palustris]